MMQVCNDEYWKGMESLKPDGAPCGKTFNDYDHMTTCPHERILSREERLERARHLIAGMGT